MAITRAKSFTPSITPFYKQIMLHVLILRFVRKRSRLRKLALKLKFLLMRGPWRNAFIRFYQTRSKRPPLALPGPTLFSDLNVEATVLRLREAGYSAFIQVPQHVIDEINAFRDLQTSANVYHAHKRCKHVEKIARDPKVVAVAREYLGVEPLLYATRLYYTKPELDASGNRIRKDSRPCPIHFDVADFKDLTLFIYLSDVDADASPHLVIEGTHKHKTLREIFKGTLTEEEARRRFGLRIKTVTGGAGTGFFEDTSAYHKPGEGKQGRWMLLISYAIQRNPRLSRES